MTISRHLKTTELADLLHLDPETLRRAAARGELKPVRIGRDLLWPLPEVLEWFHGPEADTEVEAVLAETRDYSPRDDHGSWVYFIQAGDGGPVKIGLARNARGRLANLQCGNHTELRILGCRWGPKRTETELHERFAADRLRGEWFAASESILAYVREHTE